MDLDPRRVLTFQAVAHHGSFSRAAEELSLTQSAVSQQVGALERQLGVRLLHRGRGGVRPTAAGATLLEHASALADRLALAGAQLADAGRELRVGAFPSALATIVPAAVTRLLTHRPDVVVGVQEARQEELVAGVRDGAFHVAVCFQDAALPRREHPGARRHDLLEEPMVLALPPGHRHARRAAVQLADLAADPWIAPSRDGLIHRACVAAGFEPRMSIVTRDPLAIGAMVRAGLAVTLTPRLLAAQFDGVHVAAVDGPQPLRSIYALLPDAGARELDQAFLGELTAAAA